MCSQYIDYLFVHSKSEVDFYSRELNIAKEKLVYVPLGIVDIRKWNDELKKGKTVVSVGNSNRDFPFVIESLKNSGYDVEIYSDEFKGSNEGNVKCYGGAYGKKFGQIMSDCFCMIVPLKDPNISAGQLIMLQTYAMEKPLIVTQTDGCADYIGGGAISIEKSRKALIEALDKLRNDSSYYDDVCRQNRLYFEDNFSLSAMARRLGKYF